jgi:hypothetical protein
MIDLDELLGITGPIIFVDVPDLEYLWPLDLPTRDCCGGFNNLALRRL